MPRGDRTGPSGRGAMIGRGAGYCSGDQNPGFNSSPNNYQARGRRNNPGFQSNRAGGRGWRNMFYASGLPGWLRLGNWFSPQPSQRAGSEEEELRYRADTLQSELNSIRQRLDELKTPTNRR